MAVDGRRDSEGRGWVQEIKKPRRKDENGDGATGALAGGGEARQVRVLALKGGSRRRMSAVATRVMRAASERGGACSAAGSETASDGVVRLATARSGPRLYTD